MKKIVIDTSVIVSALIGEKGPSREVLRRSLHGQYQPLISNSLFLEYEDVIRRSRIQQLCPLNFTEIEDLLHALYRVSDWIQIYYLWRPNLRDESDNFLIELAIAGNAELIVSNNIKDFANTELLFDGLRVCKPEKLLL